MYMQANSRALQFHRLSGKQRSSGVLSTETTANHSSKQAWNPAQENRFKLIYGNIHYHHPEQVDNQFFFN